MHTHNRFRRTLLAASVVLLAAAAHAPLFAAGTAEPDTRTLVFADASWDSILVHNRIAQLIIENGFDGYSVDFVPGDTIPLVTGLRRGDVHVMMESWHNNWQEVYDEATATGELVNLGENLPEGPQGWYVPTYVMKGDPGRGIDAVAPDLRSIADLPRYWELFRDPESPRYGRILVGPPGWAITEASEQMLIDAGLDEYYTAFLPGSGEALAASMVSAYERGEPWIGYYWEPTWVLGKLDMTLLPGTELQTGEVDILVWSGLPDLAPDVIEFLTAYATDLDVNNAMLAAMDEENLSAEETARWFLRNYEGVWTQWVSPQVSERVRTAVQ
ncbi:MAG: ABC transporter substrate-binding protein [Spirochaetaceae bacterium]|nr:MAG: ABC transporter substrate-binding protein [Spirochaetaceae bacterium]